MSEMIKTDNPQVAHAAIAYDIALRSMHPNSPRDTKYASELARRFAIIHEALGKGPLDDVLALLQKLTGN